MKKIVLTGANGNLGQELRGLLAGLCDQLLSTDIADGVGPLLDNETFVQADLAEMDQVRPLLEGAERVIYASSIHAMGMYPKTVRIDTEMPQRPDTYYGLAKCFTEDLGRMYWEKEGIESVHLRIYCGSWCSAPSRRLMSASRWSTACPTMTAPRLIIRRPPFWATGPRTMLRSLPKRCLPKSLRRT